MPQRYTVILLSLLLCLMLVGCGSEQVPDEPPAIPTAVDNNPTPTRLPQIETELGEESRLEEAGFSYRLVEGYSHLSEDGAISMEAADAGLNTGPGFFLTGGSPDDFQLSRGPNIVSDLMNTFVGAVVPENNSQIEGPRRIALNQTPGQEVDFVVFGEDAFRGRITAVYREDSDQVFVMVGLSPPERWENEVRPLYRELLRSVKFFTPEVN